MTTRVPSVRARRVAAAYSIRPGWLALVAAAVVAVAVGEIPLSYQYAPLVVSAVLLGLPHGAVDHLVIARQRGEGLTVRWLALVAGIYAVFGVAYGLVWFRWPVAAFVFFILMTWFHWGQGELYPLLNIVGATYLRAPSQQALTVLVRGGAPMAVPLVAFPDQYEFVATSLIGLFDPGAAAALAPLFEPGPRTAVGVVYGTAVVVTILLGYVRAGQRQPWLVDAGEMVLLSVFFLVVPPILAVGVYFCFWHSLRHIIRTVMLHDRSTTALDRADIAPVARQFARDAAPMTAGALVFLGLLYLLVPREPGDLSGLVALYLVLIAVLTLPHVVIVSWLDREQSVF
ncbi:beta-carotene 15,15'-dioxygenase, Brp/Blh family [Halovenus sp. WSH3]|uniref:Probable beta-carotene 15,15'-dioxygenase n=1 Tax=Halovenus carboxidivorans TaxID=2692199 RepID=A0A6B0T7B7_9EURY|nr:Brp/Blh family beta-carotene 15,15'-dioxygenase [Halovenus carboxidivorans]MXR51091.1 beta-carotene 15,15'-dioxygenase, Brp/Blh family [Halovenus carboxidivorans]